MKLTTKNYSKISNSKNILKVFCHEKVIIGILAMTCLLCGTGQIVASAAENSDISGLTGNFTVDSNGSTDSPDKIRVTVTL